MYGRGETTVRGYFPLHSDTDTDLRHCSHFFLEKRAVNRFDWLLLLRRALQLCALAGDALCWEVSVSESTRLREDATQHCSWIQCWTSFLLRGHRTQRQLL